VLGRESKHRPSRDPEICFGVAVLVLSRNRIRFESTEQCGSALPPSPAIHDVGRDAIDPGAKRNTAVAEASHNRVLVVQLISLQHVSWPAENPTLTPEVARRILKVHQELAALIEMRDPAGARRLMDDHVKMIGARRVAENRHRSEGTCC